jgi:hypothetical protein
MEWKFWKKEGSAAEKQAKALRPKDLPSPVGRVLVVEMKQEPDWVWKLKCVMQPVGEEAHVYDLRVFDPDHANARSVLIKNYSSLDENPELILYSGIYYREDNQFRILKSAA